MGRYLLALVMLAACSIDARTEPESPWRQPHAPWLDPEPEPPPVARFKDPAPARYHMRRHFDDLRMIEQLLLVGKLSEATTLAYLLVEPRPEPGLEEWEVHATRVSDAALELSHAPGIDEALRREARVAAECAGCHLATQRPPVFAPAGSAPMAGTTLRARMNRHVWAADRLWEAVVAGDDVRWHQGLAVLAESPPPFPPLTDAPHLAKLLQDRARAESVRPPESIDERATAYGEMLVVCAACHSVAR